MNYFRLIICASLLVVFSVQAHEKDTEEKKEGLSILVLGSGGPVAMKKGRAGAGYLIFTDGVPRILMDVGGGTFQRLAKSGVDIKDLDTILLSHLHIDHTADLSAIVKTIYFHNNAARGKQPDFPGRTAPINIYGPASTSFPDGPGSKFPGTDILQYPSTKDYADLHYSVSKGGVERYLNAFASAISGGKSKFAYTATDLSSDWKAGVIETLFEKDGLRVTSIALNHGPVPAVGFRIDYKGKSIAYSGDTSSKTDNMIMLSQDVDLLFYDTAITDELPNNPIFHLLHTSPTRMGAVAAAANVKKLVLSHITPTVETRLHEVKHAVRLAGFHGKIRVARDLKMYSLD